MGNGEKALSRFPRLHDFIFLSFLVVLNQVPLLGGALCACTWHFFYNDESLEVKKLLTPTFSYKSVICFVCFFTPT